MRKIFGATLLGISIALTACSVDKSDVEYLAAAKGFYSGGNLEEASIELKNALRINANNGNARILLGKIYLEWGDGQSALKEFTKAKDIELSNNLSPLIARAYLMTKDYQKVVELVEGNLSPSDLNDLRVSKGMAHLSLAQTPLAINIFNKVLVSDPESTYALLGVARYKYEVGEFTAAKDSVTRVIALDPEYGDAWSVLGGVEKAQGELEKSEEAYTRAIEAKLNDFDDTVSRALIRIGLDKIDEAAADINSLPSRMSEHPSANYAKGLLHLRRQDFDLAQASFEKVLNTSDDYLPALFYSGVSHASLGQSLMAEDKLSRYVAKMESFPPANHMLAMMKYQSGDYQAVEELLKDLVKKDETEEAVFGLLSDALLAQGKKSGALSLLETLATQRPDSVQAKLILSKVMSAIGDERGAINNLEKALSIDSGFSEGYAQLVSIYLSQGSVAEAVAVADRFIKQSEGSISAHNLLATIYLSQGDDRKATDAFNKVLSLDSNDMSANSGMAAIAVKGKDFDGALNFYRKILAVRPGDLQTLLNAADVYMVKDETAAAREAIEKAVSENPLALEPRIRLGWFHAHAGDEDKIPELLSGFQRRHPDNVALLVLLADSAYKTRNYSEAERLLVRLRALAPENAGIAYSLARTHAARKNNREYLDALGEVIGIDPANVRARVELANYLVVLDKFAEAQDHIDYLNQRISGSAEVLLLEGKIAEKRGDFDAAVKAYLPIYSHTKSNLNLVRLTNAQWNAGQKVKALSLLEKWLIDYPEDVAVQMELAAHYLSSDRGMEAAKLYEAVVSKTPENALALNNLAWLLKDSNNKRAIELAEAAYKKQPRSADIMDTLALVLQARGEGDDAARAERLLERAAQAKQ